MTDITTCLTYGTPGVVTCVLTLVSVTVTRFTKCRRITLERLTPADPGPACDSDTGHNSSPTQSDCPPMAAVMPDAAARARVTCASLNVNVFVKSTVITY